MKIQNCLNSVLILSFRYPVTLMSRFPKISKFGQKVLNLGLFFGIFDEILPKFIRLMFQSSLEDKKKVQTLTISTVSTVLSSMNLAGRRLLMFQRSWHQFRKNFFGFSFCPSFHDQRMALEKNELTRKYVTGVSWVSSKSSWKMSNTRDGICMRFWISSKFEPFSFSYFLLEISITCQNSE